MRAKINSVKISFFIAQLGFQPLVNLVHIVKCYKAFGYHRLIGYNDTEVIALIQKPDSFGNSGQKFKVFRSRRFIHIPVEDAVPVKKNSGTGILFIQTADFAAFDIGTDNRKPVFGSHIFNIFGAVVGSERFSRLQQSGKDVFAEILRRIGCNIREYFLVEDIYRGINQIVVNQAIRMRLGQ